MQHTLLTVLGTNPKDTCYVLGGKQAKSRLAPLALFELLPDTNKPDRILAVCTQEAETDSFPILEGALDHKVEISKVDVPSGTTQEEIFTFVSTVSQALVVPGCQTLSVDVTHGLRHFSFLTYVIALYVSALKGLEVHGAYYGLHQNNGLSPFLDLGPLLELPDWLHGVRVLGETGSTASIAAALSRRPSGGFTQDIVRDLERISTAYLSGLPLEVGALVGRLLHEKTQPLRRLLANDFHLPLVDELVSELESILAPLALANLHTSPGWKDDVPLTKDELERQAALINSLLKQKSTATALGLMREWAVSWAIWQQYGQRANWLDYDCRSRAECILNSLRRVFEFPEIRPLLTDEQRDLAQFWADLTSLRNAFHHHGMRPQVLTGDKHTDQQLKRITERWKHLSMSPTFTLDFSRGGTLLVSPIGRRPGVLFSAIRNSVAADVRQLDGCLLICSSDTEKFIPEAVQKAGHSGLTIRLRMDDPYGGHGEMRELIKKARQHLADADRVLVNVTGGTTLMGLLAQEIAAEAKRLGRTVRRFGLIDRRPPDEQDADPYVVAECFWLDGTEGSTDEDDN